MTSSRLPNRNQGLVTAAACFYLQPLSVRVTGRAFGPSLTGDAGRDSEYHNAKLLRARLHMHGYPHDASVYAMGNISAELLGGPQKKVTVICLGTHHCLLRQWGLMTVQQRAALRPDPSQSMSMGTTADLQLSSMFAESMKGLVRGLGFSLRR